MTIDKLHYISQAAADGSHLTAIKKALEAGCKWIQLRIKEEQQATVLALATEAVLLCRHYGARIVINDYPEIAVTSGADGVHLGLADMPVAEARIIVGSQRIIGGTANSFEDVMKRAEEGVDYIGLGPYRYTTTKKNLSPILGLEGYSTIYSKATGEGIKIPIIAIGGIEVSDIPLLLPTGVSGVAVSGAITHAADQPATVQQIHKALQQHHSIAHQ